MKFVKKDIEESRGHQVVKHNDLIQKSRYELSLQEHRIILYLISKIKPDDKIFHEYTFKIKDFCEVCGMDETSGKNYALLKQTMDNLTDKKNWIILKDQNGGEWETTLRWIEKVAINKKSGIIKIRIDSDMTPYLLKLKRKFTSYSLYFTLAMKSKYSIRLYELLKSYENLIEYEFEIENLKILLSAEKYKLFGNFQDKVLSIAKREINDYSDILISYELEKQGRKFHKIKFLINPKYKEKFDESIRTWKNINRVLNKK